MRQRKTVGLIFGLATFLSACIESPIVAPVQSPSAAMPAPIVELPTFSQTGMASWYGGKHAGQTTANGERFDMQAMTAAHRNLPFGTIVRVTSLTNDRTIKVRINDRGPYEGARIIDLSAVAARVLGVGDSGIVKVKIEALASDQP